MQSCNSSLGACGVSLAVAIVLAMMLGAPHFVAAQSSAALEPMPLGRLLIDGQIGNETELGFKLPSFSVGFTIEKPVGPHVELQTSAAYSPDKKFLTNDGNSLLWGLRGIWLTRLHVGISGEIRNSHLWTSEFHKSGWTSAAGVMIRDDLLGLPGRFSADYVVPTGCVWAAKCKLPADGIQSNRTQGPEFYQEFRVLSAGPKFGMRLGGKLAFYHFCDQTNPLIIAPRTCHLANTSAMTLRLEFGGKDRWW